MLVTNCKTPPCPVNTLPVSVGVPVEFTVLRYKVLNPDTLELVKLCATSSRSFPFYVDESIAKDAIPVTFNVPPTVALFVH